MTTGVTGPDQGSDRRRRRCARTAGGCCPLTTFVVFAASSSTRRSGRSRARTTTPRPTSRRSTRRASPTASRARPTSASRSAWCPLSPALLILIFPLGFRLTCYYYRKAYYRAFWLSPPACAVAEPHKKYTGETRFPLILQNVHRYFWYAAIVVA